MHISDIPCTVNKLSRVVKVGKRRDPISHLNEKPKLFSDAGDVVLPHNTTNNVGEFWESNLGPRSGCCNLVTLYYATSLI